MLSRNPSRQRRDRRPPVEALESRRHLDATPAHTSWARRSVAETLPENNEYYNGNPVVTWAGTNGATQTTNKSDCTTYITVLLKQAYGFTSTQFIDWTTKSSPSLPRYYDAALANDGFEAFKQIAEVRVGDLFISRYTDPNATAYGHMTIVDSPPVLSKTTATGNQYVISMIDVTGSTHSNDTRSRIDPSTGETDNGVGRGQLRFFTDLAGNLQYWAWGTSTTATTYSPDTHPCTFVRTPPAVLSATPNLTAATPSVTIDFPHAIDPSSVAATDLAITNTTTGGTFAATGVTMSADGTHATFALPRTLTNGNYRFRLPVNSVSTPAGNKLAATFDLTGGDAFVLAGDVNRDHAVNFDDLLVLAQNYGGTGRSFAQGNVNNSADGAVDFDDLLVVAQNYGTSLFADAPVLATPARAKSRAAAGLL